MKTRDMFLAFLMVISVIVFSYEWLTEFWGESDSLIVLSSITLVAALALMILSINKRLDEIETKIDERERSLRMNIQSLEDEVEERFDSFRKKI